MRSVSWFSVWSLVFMALTMVVSLVLLFLVFFPLGYSMGTLASESDPGSLSRAFMINAILSGIIADQVLKRRFTARIMAIKTPPLPFIWLWIAVFVMMLFVGFESVKKFIENISAS